MTRPRPDGGMFTGPRRACSGCLPRMWERLAFYTMVGVLLYMTDSETGGLGWSRPTARSTASTSRSSTSRPTSAACSPTASSARKSVLIGGICSRAAFLLATSSSGRSAGWCCSAAATASSSRTSRRWSATSTRRGTPARRRVQRLPGDQHRRVRRELPRGNHAQRLRVEAVFLATGIGLVSVILLSVLDKADIEAGASRATRRSRSSRRSSARRCSSGSPAGRWPRIVFR